MADPISVIAAVALAAHTLRRTCEFIQGISGAPSTILTINRDLKALQIVIDILEKLLRDSNFALADRNNQVISLVQTPLQNCAVLCENLYKRIEPCVKGLAEGRISKWRPIARFKFWESEVKATQQDLASAKATLEVGISLAQL